MRIAALTLIVWTVLRLPGGDAEPAARVTMPSAVRSVDREFEELLAEGYGSIDHLSTAR